MPEKKEFALKMSSSNKCNCCPYGFHIDRDFVRYCDSLYNTAQLDKLKQHKRERRKEKKSVESYLGLGISPPAAEIIEKKQFQMSPITHNYATLPRGLHHHNDGLENAMQDFEDTWQKSLKKSCSSNDIGLKKNGFIPIKNKPAKLLIEDKDYINYNEPSRSSSTSSVSSQSTAISSASVPISLNAYPTPELMVSSIDSVSKLRLSSPVHGVGINKSVLTNIRERMASSLYRMKELEEQVKAIPVLQVKLYALSEEKKTLLNQLQAKETSSNISKTLENQIYVEKQIRRLENEGIMSPTFSRKRLSGKSPDILFSPKMASQLDASPASDSSAEKRTPIRPNISVTKTPLSENKTLRNAATSCSVLTRDIGIGYVPSKLKSIGVGSDVSFNELINSYKYKNYNRCGSIASESLGRDTECFVSDEWSKPFAQTRPHPKTPPYIPRKVCVDSSTSTDTKYYFSRCINTEQSFFKPISEPVVKSCKNKSVTASPLVSARLSQTDKMSSRSVGCQSSIDIKPKIQEIIKPVPKRDVAVGDFNIKDVMCSNCQKSKKSVGVGDFFLKTVVCDICSPLQPQSRPNSFVASHSGNCENCVLRQTETVGVGDYDVNNALCPNCECSKAENLQKIRTLSIGTNTLEETSITPSASKSGMQICDKCSATIHSVAQGFAANNTSSVAESKIPRPSLKLGSVGKTNHTKLAKLKIEVSKSQRVESTVVKSVGTSRNSSPEKRISPIRSNSLPRQVMSYSSTKTVITENIPSTTPSQLPYFTNLPIVPHEKVELSKEVKAACKVLNDYLKKPDRGGEKKTMSSLTIIQTEWFRVANQKRADPHLIEDYLDAFEEFSKLLLQRVVNLADVNGNTALHYAISYGNFDVVSILIDSKVCDVNKKNRAGYTSIMLVALADMRSDAHHYVVQRLFNIGDINVKATQNGQTALMLAVSHGKRDIVKILLDAGAEVNLQDKDGSTALMCAAEHGHLEIVKLLLSHPECDPTIVDNDDCNALTIAMEAGHKDIGLLIYTNMNFSRGSSPYSTLKTRKRSTPRSTPPPRTPTLRTPPLPSPSARSTNSIPASFHFPS